MNDFLYPLNAYKARNLEFKVFDRWGKLVFETRDWTKKWDGNFNGEPQPTGVYVWMLTYFAANKQLFKKAPQHSFDKLCFSYSRDKVSLVSAISNSDTHPSPP